MAKSIFGCGAERCSRLPSAALGSCGGAGVRFQEEEGAHCSLNLQISIWDFQESGVLCYSSTHTTAFPIGAELERANERDLDYSGKTNIWATEGGRRGGLVSSQGVSGSVRCPSVSGEGLDPISPSYLLCPSRPPRSHRGSDFLSTSLIFRSTFCTMHCSLLR